MEDEESEKKKKKRDWLGTIGKIVRLAKYMANPIIFWIVIGIAALILLAAVIGFLMSMPGDTLAKITSFLGITGNKNNIYKVEQKELIELCDYIQDMGYDIEGYGFADEVERENDPTYNTQSFQNNQPARGKIKSVKSKYLTAYLVAEKKTYAFSNPNYQRDADITIQTTEYQTFYKERAVSEVFESWWGTSGGEIINSVNKVYDLNGGVYEKKRPFNDYVEYDKIQADQIKDKMKTALTYYYLYKDDLKMSIAVTVAGTFLSPYDIKLVRAYQVGAEIIRNMQDGAAFISAIDAKRVELEEQFSQENDKGVGMIVLENSEGINTNATIWDWLFSPDLKVSVKIDEKSRKFIIGSSDYPDWLAKIFGDYNSYAYDLNEWTCKYGKPTEFLIALHLATQAPDFALQVATSPAVETKVHVALYPTTVKTELITMGDGNNPMELSIDDSITTASEDALKDIIQKEEFGRLRNLLNSRINAIKNEAESSSNNTLKTHLNNLIKAQEIIEKTANGQATLSELNSALNNIEEAAKYLNNMTGTSEDETVQRILGAPYNTNLNLLLNMPQIIRSGVSLTVMGVSGLNLFDIWELQSQIRKYNLSFKTATPYITKVVNHWYRNQYFTKSDTEIAGAAYQITPAPAPFYYELSQIQDGKLSDNPKVDEILKRSVIKETRGTDIVQMHNPRFEDNSMYIRSWLKEKYYIFDGSTTQNTNGGKTIVLNSEKMAEGKKYIQGKSALESVKNMLENCDDRQNVVYMQRDLIELFEDFEFDLENVDAPAQKVLSNVMPEYVPYTAWPSVYEKEDSNGTKMIYKASSANLVAPADGVITKNDNGTIEIEFEGDNSATSILSGGTLRITAEQGTISSSASLKTEVKQGDTIGSVSAPDGTIIINLKLFSATKQLMKVEDYMRVDKKSYQDLSNEEKTALYNLQEAEVEKKQVLLWKEETTVTVAQRTAIVNVVLNKINSPNHPNCKDVISAIEDSKDEFEAYSSSTSGGSLAILESNENARYAIINALNGIDNTKTSTLLGATSYLGIYDGDSKEQEKLEKMNETKIKMQIQNRFFYISEEDYDWFISHLVDKKINEVIYVLNKEKYVMGLEEYSRGSSEYEKYAKNFEDIKKQITEYYKDNKYQEGSFYMLEPTVTSLVKSGIKQEFKDIENGQKEITDTFLLTANANYVTEFKMKYKTGAEGKIITDIELEIENKPGI